LREQIKERAAEIILHELNDPRIGFCTITRAELTPDLAYSTIFVSVLGTEAQQRTTMRGLLNARGLIQAKIAKGLKTRTTPHLTIEFDRSIERTFQILDKIKEARKSDPDGGLGDPEDGQMGDGGQETESAEDLKEHPLDSIAEPQIEGERERKNEKEEEK
jgi:ribosome-binding factor A